GSRRRDLVGGRARRRANGGQRQVVAAMDAYERAARIAELRESSARILAELERRQAERADPVFVHEQLVAERRAARVARSIVKKSEPPLVFKTHDNSAPATAAAAESLAPLFSAAQVEALGRTIAAERQRARAERRQLEDQVLELRTRVDVLLQLLS